MSAPILPVMFRRWPKKHGGDVDAYFPTLIGTLDPRTCTCYAHVGQHGSADLQACIMRTRPANVSEPDTAALLAELRGIYENPHYGEVYRLVVVQRVTPAMRRERQADLQRIRAGGAS